MDREKLMGPLGGFLLLAGLFLYVWPMVANAGAPYVANSPIAVIGLLMLLIGLCIVRR
ncbi:MAG: hypothetical protein RTU09_00590 [Candidatus Thorarchaeota archaeon]